MLVSLKSGADFSSGCARPPMQPPFSATRPHPQHKEPEPCQWGSGPKRITPRATVDGPLAWVEVNHHPPTARAPLASHPRTTLNVVHTPLKASQAGPPQRHYLLL